MKSPDCSTQYPEPEVPACTQQTSTGIETVNKLASTSGSCVCMARSTLSRIANTHTTPRVRPAGLLPMLGVSMTLYSDHPEALREYPGWGGPAKPQKLSPGLVNAARRYLKTRDAKG